MKKSNLQKITEISTLTEHFSPKEISEITGLSQNSVYHFQRKYDLPTYKDTERQLIDKLLMKNIEGKERALQTLHQIRNA